MRGRHSDVSDPCLCVQMPFHMHALFWLCLIHSPSFSLLGFEPNARQNGRGVEPRFPLKVSSLLLGGSVSVRFPLDLLCSGDLVTFDRLKTQAPPLIGFPEPLVSFVSNPVTILHFVIFYLFFVFCIFF